MPEVPREIFTDLKRLTRILINLVSNAIKYTLHGSVDVVVDLAHSQQLSYFNSQNFEKEV